MEMKRKLRSSSEREQQSADQIFLPRRRPPQVEKSFSSSFRMEKVKADEGEERERKKEDSSLL